MGTLRKESAHFNSHKVKNQYQPPMPREPVLASHTKPVLALTAVKVNICQRCVAATGIPATTPTELMPFEAVSNIVLFAVKAI